MLCGCDKDAKSIEEKEERNPLVKTGHAFMEKEDWAQAINSFKQAIESNPRMARPHLDLATIYQQHQINYIHAIYHYDRYLELRPDSQKAEFINSQRQRLAKALANTFINNSEDVKRVVQELNRLQKENADLKGKLASTTAAPKTTTATAPKTTRRKTAVQTAPKTKAAPTTQPKPTYQIYHVAKGDTLSKIASRFYGDSTQWDAIYQANKDRMKSAGDLRPGQTLVIPSLGQ
jgi:LysM repeat protein